MTTKELEKTVVLVTGTDRRSMVREALTRLGESFEQLIKNSKKIFIHPNLVNWRMQGACTHVEAVRGVLDHVSLVRADKIVVGDAGFHDTNKAFEAFSYDSLARSGNVRLVDLNDDEVIPSWSYTADLKKKPLGFSKTVAESDCNIVVVPAKMHSYYIVSLSIKTHIVGSQVVERSPFGIHARWPWLHTGYRPAHLTLAEVYAEHPAQCAIIDGTQAMEGNGPASGTNVDLGWVLASLNPIAADAVAGCLMGLKPRDIGYLYYLNEKGYSPIEMKDLITQGADPASLRRELKRPDSYPGILDWREGNAHRHKLSHRLRSYYTKLRS